MSYKIKCLNCGNETDWESRIVGICEQCFNTYTPDIDDLEPMGGDDYSSDEYDQDVEDWWRNRIEEIKEREKNKK